MLSFTFFSDKFCSAFRAIFQIFCFLQVGIAFGKIDSDNLWNNVSPFFHKHKIAFTHIKFFDLIRIVQGSAFYSGSGQQHRLQVCNWRNCTGATNLISDFVKLRGNLFCFKFISHGPSWRFCGETEFFLLPKIIDLYHHAIGFIGKFVPMFLPIFDEIHHLFTIFCQFGFRRNFKSPTSGFFQTFKLGFHRQILPGKAV